MDWNLLGLTIMVLFLNQLIPTSDAHAKSDIKFSKLSRDEVSYYHLQNYEYLQSLLIKKTAQKTKLSIKDFFSKCDQIRRKLRIWSHLLKKSLMENFIFCVANEEVIWDAFKRFSDVFLYSSYNFLIV